MACNQLWRCPTCGAEYRPAMDSLEVLCGKPHPPGKRGMVLVEGTPTKRTEPKGKSHVASGKV